MQLGSLTLPGNLYWVDEFAHLPFAQSKERSVAGGMVIESAPLLAGQKITLTGDWVKRPQLIELQALQASVDVVRVLTLNDGTTSYSVLFDIEAGGVEAELLSPELNPTNETIYELTLHFITV